MAMRCRWLATAAFAALFVSGARHGFLDAQSTTAQTYASVVDDQGNAVTDLRASDFLITLDGRPADIVTVTKSNDPVSLALAINADLNDLPAIKAAVHSIVDALRATAPGTRVGVRLPGSDSMRFAPVEDRVDALEGLSALTGRDYGLLNAIVNAARSLGNESARRRVVLAVDRLDALVPGEFSAEEVAESLRATRSALWAIEMTNLAASGQTQREIALLDVSEMSGGGCETVFGVEGLQAAARQITGGLVSRYVITYTAGSTAGQRTLRVGVRRSGVKVFAPSWTQD